MPLTAWEPDIPVSSKSPKLVYPAGSGQKPTPAHYCRALHDLSGFTLHLQTPDFIHQDLKGKLVHKYFLILEPC